VIARHIIDVIAPLLLNNITQLAQSGCVLEICKFIGHGYISKLLEQTFVSNSYTDTKASEKYALF